MNDTIAFINSLMPQQEQWPMSYAYNEPGMSLREYHPENNVISPAVVEMPTDNTSELANVLADAKIESVFQAATDGPDNVGELAQQLLGYSLPRSSSRPTSISAALDKLKGDPDALYKAKRDIYQGALLRTVVAAGDLFDKGIGVAYGLKRIKSQRETAEQNYDNQMAALDNQLLYLKNQMADRFNKTVETNIMNLAARNLRVTSGNVLELTKDAATEISEDIRMAESNVRLKEIAMEAGKKQVKESASYAKKQLWTGFAQSAINLGLMVATGGGTDEKFGDLYKGYKESKTYFANKA